MSNGPLTLQSPATVAAFEERRRGLREQTSERLSAVDQLSRQQVELGEKLGSDLALLRERGTAIQPVEESTGLAALFRRFTVRREALARRSATAALVEQYEVVQTALRRASHLADELAATAHQLQADVDQLHADRKAALADATSLAERVLELQQQRDASTDPAERDRLDFQLASEGTRLTVVDGLAELCGEQLPVARRLRDTVQSLHAQTARYVLNAAGTVREAGRNIHALGTAADAPVVLAELHEALTDLESILSTTEGAVTLASDLVNRVLPSLDARLSAMDETRRLVESTGTGRALDELAASALRRAAEAEVEALEP